MGRRPLRGLTRTKRILRRLPDDTAAEVVTELNVTGRSILNAVLARTPRRRGHLRAAIRMKVLPKSLRLQIGLIGSKAERNDVFYGRILDLGRKAQTVLVQRRRRVEVTYSSGATYSILRLRHGRKISDDIVSTYRMNVPAIEPKRFITGRYPELRSELTRNMKGIYSRGLRRSAGVSGE